MLNRKESPKSSPINKVKYLLPEKNNLSNGIMVFGLNAGSQELVKIDFIFEAGSCYQEKNLVAGLTNAFLNLGTKSKTAFEIAEFFDFRGAYLQLYADQHHATISVLCLTKDVEEILQTTYEVIYEATFPEDQLEAMLNRKRSKFIVENNKVKFIAQKKFSQIIYGSDHPYANTNGLEDYNNISQTDLKDFHCRRYQPQYCKIVVAGKYDDSLFPLLDKIFGKKGSEPNVEGVPKILINSGTQLKHFYNKDNAVQSAIRVGCIVPNRNHPDYFGLNVLVTLLGGYFGSRLMTNIREDKGYSYGIYSGVYSMPMASTFTINTEVGCSVTQPTLNEIYSEINRLRSEKVGSAELDLVRNFLLGETLRNFDGIFAASNSLKTLLEANLDYTHFEQFIEVINTIQPNELMTLCNKYLNPDSMFEVVVGNMS